MAPGRAPDARFWEGGPRAAHSHPWDARCQDGLLASIPRPPQAAPKERSDHSLSEVLKNIQNPIGYSCLLGVISNVLHRYHCIG